MVADNLTRNEDVLITRRALRALRSGTPLALAAGLLAFFAAFVLTGNPEPRFESEGAVELTDDRASGITSARSRPDALREIDGRVQRLNGAAFFDAVAESLGEPGASGLINIGATAREQTPVVVISATATSPSMAVVAVDRAIDHFVASRDAELSDRIEAELASLRSQRDSQLSAIDSLGSEIEAIRATATASEISILENRTASSLSRLADYNKAIQEREFLSETSNGQVRIVNRAGGAASLAPGRVARPAQLAVLVIAVVMSGAVLFSRFRGQLNLLDEVRSIAGPDIPILATVPKFRPKLRKGREALVVGRRNTRREAEAFRYMRTAIEVATDGMTPVVVAFTSSGPNEGKTVTSSNFALATARAQRSVALLDGDLLNPSTGKLFGVNGSNAFVGILTGRIDPTTEQWHRVVTSGEPLDVLVSGRQSAQAERQELPTHAVEATFAKLAQMWDTVVVDCPPVLAVSDAMVLARAADVAILMVRMGHTTKRDLDKALTQLEQNQVNIAGIVVTHSTDKDESYYGYGYAYGVENG